MVMKSLKVLWTSSREDSSLPDDGAGVQALTQHGCQVAICPAFLIRPLPMPVFHPSASEVWIFVTRRSVEALHTSGVRIPAGARCMAVGAGTAETFRACFPGSAIHFPAVPEEQNSEGMFQWLTDHPFPETVVRIFRGDSGREWLADRLREIGKTVEYVTCYERHLNPAFRQCWATPSGFIPDLVVLTSTESLRVFLETPKAMGKETPWITVLPGRMTALAAESGYSNCVPIHDASDAGIVAGVLGFTGQ